MVSNRFIYKIVDALFDGVSGQSVCGAYSTSNDMYKQESYTEFLEVNIDDVYNYEVPVICRGAIMKQFTRTSYDNITPKSSKFIFPLFIHGTYNYGTVATAIMNAFELNNDIRMCKLIVKDRVYYGGNGIILDSNKNLLLLVTSIHSVLSSPKFFHCYVSPEVFKNDDIMNKAIIKRVIPALMTSDKFNYGYDENKHKVVDVIVKDFVGDNKWMYNTLPPKDLGFNSDLKDSLKNTNFKF